MPVSGHAGVPDSGAEAVLLTVTVTGATSGGYVAVFPDGQDPGTSTVNFAAGQTIANTTIVALPGSGSVDLHNGTAGTLHLIVDVSGWYSTGDAPIAGGFVPVPQRRLVDTRRTGNPLRGTAPLTVPVSGIPADATAVAVNITAVRPTVSTALTVWPAGQAKPLASVLNPIPGSVVANLAIVGLGASGALSLGALGGTTDVLVDLIGYVAGGTAATGGTRPVAPYRVLDTRTMGTKQPVGPGKAVEVIGSGAPGVPVTGVAALVMTVTTTSSTAGGYLTAWPSGTSRPTASILNPRTDRPVPATVVVPVGADGGVNIYNSGGTTHVIVDVTGYVPADLPTAVPVNWSTMDTSPVDTAQGRLARQVLLTANRYALTTWWPQTAPGLLARPMDSNAQSDTTDAVRRLSMEAMALAVSLRTGAYDPAVVGVPASDATSVAAKLIDAVASAHVANRARGWGDSWQSALWSSLAGRAGWFLWDDLPAATQHSVARMVAWEADQSLLVPVRTMRNRAGTVLTPGDTGAEEDSWYALAPALATAMFPDSPHWSAWRHQEELTQINGWARPADVTSSTQIDGVSESTWLLGSNVERDGSVVNHKRIAPDYATMTQDNADALMFAALAGTSAPQSTVANLAPVYDAMYSISYPYPQYLSPGGTVYSVAASSVYYPQGCDWGTGQQLPYALFDAQAGAFGYDGGYITHGVAASQAVLHAQAEAAMQARNTSGATYAANSTEYTYVGREEHSAQLAAQLYLTYFVQRLGFSVTASYSPWSVGGTAAGATPRSATGSHLAPSDERRLMQPAG